MADMEEQPGQASAVRELVFVLRRSDARTQAYLLLVTSDYLPWQMREAVLEEAIAATSAIQSEPDRIDVLKRLVHRLPARLLPQALSLSCAMPAEIYCARALEVLAPKLPSHLLLDALSLARSQRSEYCRALSLSALASWLPALLKRQVSLEALAAARAIQAGWSDSCVYRARALGEVANSLSDGLRAEVLQEALAAARATEGENGHYSMALSDLAPKLPKALRGEVLKEALEAAVTREEGWVKAKALSALVPNLPADLLLEALAAARALAYRNDRAVALVALADRLPGVVTEAFVAVEETRSECTRAAALVALAHNLSAEQLLKAVAMAKDLRFEGDRIVALIALAAPMSKLPKRELFPLWQAVLRLLSSQDKQAFAHTVLALVAVVHSLGGQAAVVETIASIADGRAGYLRSRMTRNFNGADDGC